MRYILAMAALLLSASLFAADRISISDTDYRSADGTGMFFDLQLRSNRIDVINVTEDDAGPRETPCGNDPDYLCTRVGHALQFTLAFAVPRDIERRIPSRPPSQQDAPKSLNWTTAGFEYRAHSNAGVFGNFPAAWAPVGFLGRKIKAIWISVYRPGSERSEEPVSNFLYSPEHGVLAFDFPFGSGSSTVLKSYWLEDECGLIPIAPCHQKKAR